MKQLTVLNILPPENQQFKKQFVFCNIGVTTYKQMSQLVVAFFDCITHSGFPFHQPWKRLPSRRHWQCLLYNAGYVNKINTNWRQTNIFIYVLSSLYYKRKLLKHVYVCNSLVCLFGRMLLTDGVRPRKRRRTHICYYGSHSSTITLLYLKQMWFVIRNSTSI